MFDFNKDVETRDKLIFGEYDEEKYMGGVRRFENVDTETIKKLIDLKFLDPEETQNSSPSTREMVEFAEKWGNYYFDGYVVSKRRTDYRVNLDTISKFISVDQEEVIAFTKKFRFADEFDADGTLYAWYD